MPEIIRNLKIETSTPRHRRRDTGEDGEYVGPIQTGIVGRLTIKDAPKESVAGEPCNSWCPPRPWTQQKKEAVMRLAGKVIVRADPIEVDDE